MTKAEAKKRLRSLAKLDKGVQALLVESVKAGESGVTVELVAVRRTIEKLERGVKLHA